MFRVLFVNEARWGEFTTSDENRMLPEGGDWEELPLLTPTWGELRFCEEGAAMAGGQDLTIYWASHPRRRCVRQPVRRLGRRR